MKTKAIIFLNILALDQTILLPRIKLQMEFSSIMNFQWVYLALRLDASC